MKQCDGQMKLTFDEIWEKTNKDTATPLRVFCLCSKEDIPYVNSLKSNIDNKKIKFVNSDRDFINSLSSKENIFNNIDYLYVLLSKDLLLNINLLKLLMLYYPNDEHIIITISDEKIYDEQCKLEIYTSWSESIDNYRTAINNKIDNDNILNSLKMLLRARHELPTYLDSLYMPICYDFNIVDEFCSCFEKLNVSNLRTHHRLKKITALDEYVKEKELQGGNTMNNQTPQQGTTINNTTNNFIYGDGTANTAQGDGNTITSTNNVTSNNNDLENLQALMQSIRNEASTLNENDSARIIYLLEDIKNGIQEKNQPRLLNSIGTIDSVLSIASNAPVLLKYLKTLAKALPNLIPKLLG